MTDPDDDPTPPLDDAPVRFTAPPPDHPAHALLWLADQCRARGYALGPVVELGDLRVMFRDLRQAKIEGVRAEVADDMPKDFRDVLEREEE
jgi:hypothetical protein